MNSKVKEVKTNFNEFNISLDLDLEIGFEDLTTVICGLFQLVILNNKYSRQAEIYHKTLLEFKDSDIAMYGIFPYAILMNPDNEYVKIIKMIYEAKSLIQEVKDQGLLENVNWRKLGLEYLERKKK